MKNRSTVLTHKQYLNNDLLSSVTFSQDDVAKIIQKLDSGKAHAHDNISKGMLKICDPAIFKPLVIIFKQCADISVSLPEWKKGNIVPIYKKSDKYWKIIAQYLYYLFVEKFMND